MLPPRIAPLFGGQRSGWAWKVGWVNGSQIMQLAPLAIVVSARELNRPNEVGAKRHITGQRQVPKIFIFRNEYLCITKN